MSDKMPYHTPALLEECIEALNIKPGGTYVDATFGGGGHSRAILKELGTDGRLLSFDQDIETLANIPDDERFTFVHGNFKFLHNFLRYYNAEQIDGLLVDLGVSFHHFDEPQRGFTFRDDCPLDMRMNQKGGTTAVDIVNGFTVEQLTDIFKIYGELRNAKKLAQRIVNKREQQPIETTGQLLATIEPLIDRRHEKKEMSQVFQALRIAVNNELEALEKLLVQSIQALRPGGRLAIISYHSLEDRMIKNFMRYGNIEGNDNRDLYGRNLSPLKPLSSKPIVPNEAEVERNPRSRSAKLRVAEKIA